MAPLTDTMWDLIVDGAGGVVASTLYMHHSRCNRARVQTFAYRYELRASHRHSAATL